MNMASAVTRDYLTDARIGKLPFMKLKKFLSDNGVDAKEMSSASTKFALVAIAEKKEIALEPLLDELGPREAIEAPPERVLQRRPTLALTDRGGRPTPLATALTPAAEASTSAAAPATKEPEKESCGKESNAAQDQMSVSAWDFLRFRRIEKRAVGCVRAKGF